MTQSEGYLVTSVTSVEIHPTHKTPVVGFKKNYSQQVYWQKKSEHQVQQPSKPINSLYASAKDLIK